MYDCGTNGKVEEHKNKKGKGASGKEEIDTDTEFLYGIYVGINIVVKRKKWKLA